MTFSMNIPQAIMTGARTSPASDAARCAWWSVRWSRCAWAASQPFMSIADRLRTRSILAVTWPRRKQSSKSLLPRQFRLNFAHFLQCVTCRFWANVDIPHGTIGFQAVCPFCATPISGCPGYIRLIFQDNLD